VYLFIVPFLLSVTFTPEIDNISELNY